MRLKAIERHYYLLLCNCLLKQEYRAHKKWMENFNFLPNYYKNNEQGS
jgi:hypothetical protein